jgi:hypothetical protein
MKFFPKLPPSTHCFDSPIEKKSATHAPPSPQTFWPVVVGKFLGFKKKSYLRGNYVDFFIQKNFELPCLKKNNARGIDPTGKSQLEFEGK